MLDEKKTIPVGERQGKSLAAILKTVGACELESIAGTLIIRKKKRTWIINDAGTTTKVYL